MATIQSALLFYDNDHLTAELANAYINALNQKLQPDNSRAINFYSSRFDDLALISRYRVVSLPTLILTNSKNHILVRCATYLPVIDDLIQVIENGPSNDE